jgi:hypothetical protein
MGRRVTGSLVSKVSRQTNDARYVREIKSRIAKAKVAFKK